VTVGNRRGAVGTHPCPREVRTARNQLDLGRAEVPDFDFQLPVLHVLGPPAHPLGRDKDSALRAEGEDWSAPLRMPGDAPPNLPRLDVHEADAPSTKRRMGERNERTCPVSTFTKLMPLVP